MLEVRRGEWEVRDVQTVPMSGAKPRDRLNGRNHWEKTAPALPGRASLTSSMRSDKTLRVRGFLSDRAADRDPSPRQDDDGEIW